MVAVGGANLRAVTPFCCASKLVDDAPLRGIEDRAERGGECRAHSLDVGRRTALTVVGGVHDNTPTVVPRCEWRSAGRAVGGWAFWRRGRVGGLGRTEGVRSCDAGMGGGELT